MTTQAMAKVRRARSLLGVVVTVYLCSGANPSHAQQTREESLAAAQAEKARDLHPYVPSPAERRIEKLVRLTVPRPGFYPFIGGVFPGGSLAAGPGYRHGYGDSGQFDVHAAKSIRNYNVANATLALPGVAAGRIKATLLADWINAPRVIFFGVGNGSREENKASFLYRSVTLGGSVRVAPVRFVSVGASFDYLDVRTGRGKRGQSVEQAFTSVDAPGLGASPTYARTGLFAEVDSRSSPGYATSGGRYRLDWSTYGARDDAPYSFSRVDGEIDQLLPVLRANWVIALRALASVTRTDAGQIVPYFLMPDLGGGEELRGFPSWRFRDRNRVLLSAEYRWMASRFVDMALFTDAGKVAARSSDLGLTDLNTSYGIGVRFHTPMTTFLRVEFARSRDAGNALVLASGPSF